MYTLFYCEIRDDNKTGRGWLRRQWLTAGMIQEISSRPGVNVRVL